MNISVDIDTSQLRQAFSKAPIVVGGKINVWVHKTAFMTEREVKQQIPPNVDTGQLQNSVHVIPGNMRAEVKPMSKHAIYVHEGRRPGSMPPSGEGTQLNRWATKRGLNPFLVARSIGRKGTKANPFMDNAYRIVKPRAERDAKILLDGIVRGI